MSDELFQEYVGFKERDGKVAAAKVTPETVVKLSQITGGTAVMKTIRGGSKLFSGIILHGDEARIGDYVIAGAYNHYSAFPKDFFETKYKYRGVLKDVAGKKSSERR